MKITKVLGTDELFLYLEKYDIELDAQYDDILGRCDSQHFISRFIALRFAVSVDIQRSPGLDLSRRKINGTFPMKLLTSWISSSAMTTRTDWLRRKRWLILTSVSNLRLVIFKFDWASRRARESCCCRKWRKWEWRLRPIGSMKLLGSHRYLHGTFFNNLLWSTVLLIVLSLKLRCIVSASFSVLLGAPNICALRMQMASL